MPSYECSECGKSTAVRNTRGSRIKDHACSHCGAHGTLQGATAGRPSRNAGKRFEKCAACGRRGLRHGHPAFEWEPKYAYEVRPGPYPAGSPACWMEEPVPATRTRHWTVQEEVEGRLGPMSRWAGEDEGKRLGLAGGDEGWRDPRWRETCQICGNTPPADNENVHSHAILAYRFEAGFAALLMCENCGHTRLIAEVRDEAGHDG